MRLIKNLTLVSQKFWDDITRKNSTDKIELLLALAYLFTMSLSAMYSGAMGLIITFKHPFPWNMRIFGILSLLIGIYMFGAFIETLKRFNQVRRERKNGET